MISHDIRRITDCQDLQRVSARVEAIESLCFPDSHYNRYLAVGCALWGALFCVFVRSEMEGTALPASPGETSTGGRAGAADLSVRGSESPDPIAGHAIYFYCRGPMAREVYLASLAIAPEYRGLGLGRALLVESMGLLTGEGICGIEMTVAPDNVEAVSLYRSCGFVEKELKRNFYGPGEDRLLLRRDLSDPVSSSV